MRFSKLHPSAPKHLSQIKETATNSPKETKACIYFKTNPEVGIEDLKWNLPQHQRKKFRKGAKFKHTFFCFNNKLSQSYFSHQ